MEVGAGEAREAATLGLVWPGVGGLPGSAGQPPHSLECLSNTVRTGEAAEEFHICENRCRSWFCEHCAEIGGPRLRARLIDRVGSWRSPMMLTFTVDPALFESAESAFKWVMSQRAIARVMKQVEKFRHSGQWFSVVEWQKNGWPHWHVLCDAEFLPIKRVEAEWARFVPVQARHRMRVGTLGMVRFSKPGKFKSAKHAALYVSKYLVKFPENGFPAWVMQATYRIRRYSESRGFWGTLSKRREPSEEGNPPPVRSHAERIRRCGQSCTVFKVSRLIEVETGEVRIRRRRIRGMPCAATLAAGAVRRAMKRFGDLPAFVRGCFVQWRGRLADLLSFIRADSHFSVLSEVSVCRL